MPAAHRAWAGEVLAALGDPRFDADRFHLPADDDLGFVRVLPDPAFVIGTRAADRPRVEAALGSSIDDHEINDEPVATDEFWIARYPVTVAQFRAFVHDAGQKPGDAGALRDPDTRPVCRVDWSEALQYCQWLTRQLASCPALAGSRISQLSRQHSLHVCLPSELEWELAARGGRQGQVFGWGDAPDPELANHSGSGILTTSAVGCFAPNAFGLHDMLGNVWEWTRSLWDEYPYPIDDMRRDNPGAGNDEVRVVRGGSWVYSADDARCAYRRWVRPDYRLNGLGFRVVLRSAPVLALRAPEL